MAIGTKLRKLRQSLGLTQAEMSAGVMDRSFYSRIENGRSAITTEELMKILKNQSISIISFLNEGQPCQVNNEFYQDQAIEAYFNQDIHRLKMLIDNLKVRDERAKLALNFLVAKLENKVAKISPIVRKKMKYTFFQVDEMNKVTLWYLLVFMDSYDSNDLKTLMGMVFNKFKKIKNINMREIQLLACIYVNYMKACYLSGKHYREFSKAAKFLQKLPNLPVAFLPKLIGRYLVALERGDEDLANELLTYIEACGYKKYLRM